MDWYLIQSAFRCLISNDSPIIDEVVTIIFLLAIEIGFSYLLYLRDKRRDQKALKSIEKEIENYPNYFED